MKAAVLGASGIGKYHAKDLAQAGCDVIAILGRSRESTQHTAVMLKTDFGLSVTPYHDIDALLDSEDIAIVSICLPASLHEAAIEKCLENSIHVLCEKPMLDGFDIHKRAKKLFEKARKKSVLLNVNMQWAYFPAIISHGEPVWSFEVSMEPGVKGVDMLTDQLCHATSVLQKLIPDGKVRDIRVEQKSDECNIISFQYVANHDSSEVRYIFKYKKEQPRGITFSINGKEYSRKIGKNYQQSFVSGNEEYFTEDPFTVSIKRFVAAVESREQPLLSEKEILHNLEVQEKILKKYF